MAFDFSKGVKPQSCFQENIIVEKGGIQKLNFGNVEVNEDNLFINSTDPEKIYEQDNNLNIYNKWGQLKLFLEECFFLLRYSKNVKTVIYVGAAPGEHIYCIASIFSHLNFHLYDSRSYDSRLSKLENVITHSQYFEDRDVEYWKEYSNEILFISDIRTLTYGNKEASEIENENITWGDMKLQEQWVKEINPVYASLKFRLPYATDFNMVERYRKYLKGSILLQCYTSPGSSETRLIVPQNAEQIMYDILAYERKLFYHNSVKRWSEWKNIFPLYALEDFGIGDDFDSCYFKFIIRSLLEATDTKINRDTVRELTEKIIGEITPRKINKIGNQYVEKDLD